MKRFRNILVGIDLSWGDTLVADKLSPPNEEAVRQAMWVAKLNSASVHLLFALDVSAKAQQIIESNPEGSPPLNAAKARLGELVNAARLEGVAAEGSVVIGRSWLELTRRVIRNHHDLLIVGTRHQSAVSSLLFGSTSLKLLRNCPCPLWITRPRTHGQIRSVLVAHDLRPVGDLAMELGCSMSKLNDAKLHVVHAVEFAESSQLLPAEKTVESERELCRDAKMRIEEQLARREGPRDAEITVAIQRPEGAILQRIQACQADLVVMGSVGRAGISGLLIGNTAERLMSQIPCSLLAVKPEGFESPVTLQNVYTYDVPPAKGE